MEKYDFLIFDFYNQSRIGTNQCEKSFFHSYPNIYKLFVQFNTPIPSGVPIERLFSIAALILTARRENLSDLLFEHLIFFKLCVIFKKCGTLWFPSVIHSDFDFD